MDLHVFKGKPREIGIEYGKTFCGRIESNLKVLVWREGYEPLPKKDAQFVLWVKKQEQLIASNWPWLIEEMQGVAEGAQQEYDDIVLLNLRAWQYKFYGGIDSENCSSLAITLNDGSVAHAGALDDGIVYYGGMVKIVPDNGFSFFSFPIIGTSWGGRSTNSAGLTFGTSSQVLKGLQLSENFINQDIAKRVILQTCTTVKEVEAFCQKFHFTINIVATDAAGGVFCAHQTAAGLYKVTDKAPCTMTNHVVDDRVCYDLYTHGMKDHPLSPTTRFRRGKLLAYGEKHNGKCSAEDVRKMIADRDNGAPSSICPAHNIVLTYANPQQEPGQFWISEPQATGDEEWQAYEL